MKPAVYHALDSLLCMFLLFPSMVFCWRGIWDLWGYYTGYKHWVMFGCGCISVFGYFVHPLVERYIPRKNRILYQILVRVYLFIFMCFFMCYWRGIWDTIDHYFGFGLQNNLITYFCCYTILIVSRSVRSCIFPPMFAVDDLSEDVLKPLTRFSQKVSIREYMHIWLFLP